MHSFCLIPTRRAVVAACLVLCVLVAVAEAVNIWPSDNEALLAFKAATLSSSSIRWGSGDACSWQGVNCSAEGRVTGLKLNGTGLAGQIPGEIGSLSELTDLSLWSNQLEGPIPPQISSLSKLETLDLQDNNISGSIPPEICQLTRLKFLNLASNKILGPIPSCLGDMSSLTKIYLFRNKLTGGIPSSISNLTNMTALYLHVNNLTGPIPLGLVKLPLTELNLGENNLSGTIPPELCDLSSLTILGLYRNRLTGPIPPELGKLSNLTYLGLYNNQLSGPVPSALGNLSLLTILALSSNNLTGPVPLELGNLVSLTKLELFINGFTGSIPETLGNLPNLSSLVLRRNSLSGPIPPHLGNLSSLTNMDINTNNLNGSIPPEFGNLSSLTRLDLSSNRLDGSIPSQLSSLRTNLAVVDLSDNLLSGGIPPELGNLKALKHLNLSANALWGSIPKDLGTLPLITVLDLSRNNLSDLIPQDLSLPPNLTTLLLSSNHLSGSIPPELGSITTLKSLSLSGNNLTGKIPSALATLTAVVNLSSNSLSNSIPDGVKWDSKSDLSSNFLNGKVPQELASASVALNCLILETGDYIANGQRDSQACSQFYPGVKCPTCPRKERPGADGLCRCVVPLQLEAVFTANDVQSLGNFSVNQNSTLRQLAAAALLRPEQMAVDRISESDSPPTVNLRFLALPLARSFFPSDQIEAIRGNLSNTTNVTVPFFEPGFKLLPAPTGKGSRLGTGAKVIIGVGTALAVVLAASLAAFVLWRHRQNAKQRAAYESAKLRIPDTAMKSWTFAELREATGNFNEANKIGEGGFGSVYRGKLAGVPVAVKRLKLGSNQGWVEFEKELKIIGTIHNRNLVRLLGYCVQGEDHLLVYELMPNGSLQDALFDKDIKPPLSWEQCRQILLGTANAIAYLHEGCSEKIIHRDIKPANILLDSDYVAKVSDFGLALSTSITDTHVSTDPKGTVGYLAPEYYASGRLTEKSDVYSFGMVMLVVISNQGPWSLSEGQAIGLSMQAFVLARAGREIELLAPRFAEVCDKDEARRLITLALLCVQPVFQERPSMAQIVQMLSGAMDIPPISMDTIDSFVVSRSNPFDSGLFSTTTGTGSTSTNTTNRTNTSSSGLDK